MLEWVKGKWEDSNRARGDEWMQTVNRWLEVIAPCCKSVAVGRPVGQLIRTEIEQDQSMTSLVSTRGTFRLLQLTNEWKKRGFEVVEEMRENVEETQNVADTLRFDHGSNKTLTERAYEAIESVLSDDTIQDLRSSKTTDAERLEIRTQLMKRDDLVGSFAPGIADYYDAQTDEVERLLSLPTTTYRFVASALSLALRNIQYGSNVSSRNAPDITNDIIDSDIAITATQSGGLLSADRRAQGTYSDICNALGFAPAINPNPSSD